MSGAAPAGTAPRATLPSQKVRYRQGELGSLCSSDARALQGKRVRVLGSKDRSSCKRSEAPLGYLQRSIGSSRGLFALKDSRILSQRFRGVLREQDRLRPRRHCRVPPPEFPPTVHRLATRREISSVELRSLITLIMSSAPKSCELDSLPAFLIQDYVDDLLPFLTLLCNRSLQEGVLPDSQKRSVIFPALKLDGLDLKDPSNFRPISNVSFLSKIIEKIVSEQITPYLSTNDLLPKYQSGFRRGHSIETLLLRLLSDCYGAIEGGRVTLFALFDVSEAFDTIDHQSPLCLFWTLWPSSRLDYVFLGWALQLRGVGNKPVPMGPRSIWSSSRFCPGSLTISTLHF